MSFKRFDTEDITISAESIVAPAWTGQSSTLTQFYTGSQTILESGKYYYNVYNLSPTITIHKQHWIFQIVECSQQVLLYFQYLESW